MPTFALVLQDDTNTYGYNQWFYFRVRPRTPHLTVRFEIVNMRKDYSLHRKGMKIAVFSELLFHQHGKDWHRGGTNIEYSANNIGEFNGLHTLGWDYNLESTESWVYFAYAYPYTYTQLREQLTTGFLKDNKKKGEVEIK